MPRGVATTRRTPASPWNRRARPTSASKQPPEPKHEWVTRPRNLMTPVVSMSGEASVDQKERWKSCAAMQDARNGEPAKLQIFASGQHVTTTASIPRTWSVAPCTCQAGPGNHPHTAEGASWDRASRSESKHLDTFAATRAGAPNLDR